MGYYLSDVIPKNKINEYFDAKKPYAGPIKRGDIFYFDKGPTVGTEQFGGRPGIIVSADTGSFHSDNVLVVYLTTQPKTVMDVHVNIICDGRESTALCEQIHTLSTKKITRYIGAVSEEEMAKIDEALLKSIGINHTQPLETDVTAKLVKLETERDTYKDMYNTLLKRIMK